MPAADARLTNTIYPTPETLGNYSVTELLTAAAYGRIGVDKRLVKSIFARGDAAVPEIARFASEPFEQHDTANLTRTLFVLLRHFRTPEALPFFLDLVKANLEELPEELMEAVLEIGPPAVDPLLDLYDGIEDDDMLGEVAFLLASFRNRDPRILKRLLDYFEYDVADGAIILESFGDPEAVPVIEKIIAEPGLDAELSEELSGAAERLREGAVDSSEPTPAYDALEEFDDTAAPVYEVLQEFELLAMLDSPSEEYRTSAVDGLTAYEMSPKVTLRVHELARTDASATLRGRAWEALAHDPEDKALATELIAVLEDTSKPAAERAGALVALGPFDKYPKMKEAILDFYHAFPEERERVVKAMWRTLDKGWSRYIAEALGSDNDGVREQAVLGVGNLGMSSEVEKVEALFDHDKLRPAALYAYALVAPGETSRASMKSLFNRIDKLAGELDEEEAELVEAALDERLAARGLKPVFHVEGASKQGDDDGHDHPPKAAPSAKAGRNDPCPCGSGKKYKKCCGNK